MLPNDTRTWRLLATERFTLLQDEIAAAAAHRPGAVRRRLGGALVTAGVRLASGDSLPARPNRLGQADRM